MKLEKTLQLLDPKEPERKDKIVIRPYAQKDIAAHDHQFFELAYVTGGTSEHTLNDQICTVQKGDYFIVDYGSKHRYRNCYEFNLINCMFKPELIDETMEECKVFDELLKVWLMRYHNRYYGLKTVNRIFHDDNGEIGTLLTKMQEEYDRRDMGYSEILRAKLLEIIILTMRKIVREEIDNFRKAKENTIVFSVMQYIRGHYQEKAVLGRFCEAYHYSCQYISRKFKQETGMTSQEYLQKIRIEKCCELLDAGDMSVQEIAEAVGYEDVKFFHKIFRRMLHMSPGEYRKLSKI